jgi:uncharacterized CHY-type Zn-finger protein
MRNCNSCHRQLPEHAFPKAGSRGRDSICTVCVNDRRRLRAPLPVMVRDTEQVRINNAAALWFGPVRPQPRYAV